MIDIVPRELFLEYQELLLKWNKTINLISKQSETEIWNRHILDSLQLIKYIDFKDHVIDVGSGAGFPGIILSIAGIYKVTLVESDSRKAVFLRQAAKLSKNKVNVIEARLTPKFKESCDVLTCRGFSSIKNIFFLCSGLNIKKKILLLKGENYNDELVQAKKDWLFKCRLHDSITSENGKVLEITDAQKSHFNC